MKIRGVKSFCRENNIELLVLFGSSVTDKTHPASDMDLAVKYKHCVKVPKLKLIYKLEGFFNDRNIDLVVLTQNTDPLLLHEIFSKGTPVYESKKGLFVNEMLRAWNLYLDTEKIRKVNETYLNKYVKRACHVA